MASPDEEEYDEVPLVSRRYFGTGMKRKRVQFVPSSSKAAATTSLPPTPAQSAADRYLSIVFSKPPTTERPLSPAPGATANTSAEVPKDEIERPICEICHRAITTQDSTAIHETSIAHQICLHHSHPPSHFDRTRKGLAVLESQGWDPDSRLGLGAEGAGILYPVKAKANPRKDGLGFDIRKLPVEAEKAPTLDAGKLRMQEKQGKRKAAKLREAFYRSDDMEKYLGGDGAMNGNLDLAAFKRARGR